MLSAAPIAAQPSPETIVMADNAFVSSFQCPESYTNEVDLKNSYPEFDNWVTRNHPQWTLGQLIEFRYALLELHDCTQTLNNIRQKSGAPPSSGEYVAMQLLPATTHTENCFRPKVRQLNSLDMQLLDKTKELRDRAGSNKNVLHELKKDAAMGNHVAQFYLGSLYDPTVDMGESSVRKNWKTANVWYLKAAEAGLPEAEYSIGNAYANGDGVTSDDKQAVYWYRLAAEHGFVNAAWNMGVSYDYGRGVQPDSQQALQWYCAAALEGDPQAQWHMAAVYYRNKKGIGRLGNVLYWLSILQQGSDPGAKVLFKMIQPSEVY